MARGCFAASALSGGSVLAMLGALASGCSFGADDFELIAGPGAGGADGSGNGQGGGSAGDGGAGNNTKLTCGAQTNAFTVFESADLGGITATELALVSNSDNAYAVVELSDGSDPSRILIRVISDSSSDPVQSLFEWNPTGSFRLAAADIIDGQLTLIGSEPESISEVKLPIGDDGDNIDIAAATANALATPAACQGSTGGFTRDLTVSRGGGKLSYAVTCDDHSDNFSLHVSTPTLPLTQVSTTGSAPDLIVRQFVRHGRQNLMMVGEEIGSELQYRTGETASELAEVKTVSLGADPRDFSLLNFTSLPDEAGTFMLGLRFRDPEGDPALIPATAYTKRLQADDFSTLATLEADQLTQLVHYADASEVSIPFEWHVKATRSYGVSANFLLKRSVSMWVVDADGTPIVSDAEVYQGSDLIEEPRLTPLGFSFVLVWHEGPDIRGIRVACL